MTSAAARSERGPLARFEELLPGLVARIDWPAARIRAERRTALSALLAAAVERSAWHRERLRGVDPAAITETDLPSLPVMTKADLMDHFDAIVTDPRITLAACEARLEDAGGLSGEYAVIASGGASGRRGVFVYDLDGWATCYASVVRFQERDWAADPSLAGVPRVSAAVAAAHPTHVSAALSRSFSSPRSPRRLFPVSRPLSEIVAGLNDLQPTILLAYSSFLPRLCAEARAGRLRIAPRRVVAVSEPLLPEARSAAEAAWGVPVGCGYGMSEGLFAAACPHGLHLPDDLCVVEPVDAAGRPVAPGKTSQRILVTRLFNHVQPLIRYDVSDELTVLPGSCRCGSAMRLIADPQGRLDDTFVYGDVAVHPHLFRSALGRRPEIVEYQVHQTAAGADVAVVALDAPPLDRLAAELRDGLAALGLAAPEVTVRRVDALARLPSGKLTRFVAAR